MDTTDTPMGSRKLKRWRTRPLRDHETRRRRHQSVGTLLDTHLYADCRDRLQGTGDVERLLTRIALGTARPRDLTTLREALCRLPALEETLNKLPDELFGPLRRALKPCPDLHDLLERAVVEQPPVVIRDGGVIADGFDHELDELRALSRNAGDFLLRYEQQERERIGVPALKVGYNRVHGYYIELGKAHADKVDRKSTRLNSSHVATSYAVFCWKKKTKEE